MAYLQRHDCRSIQLFQLTRIPQVVLVEHDSSNILLSTTFHRRPGISRAPQLIRLRGSHHDVYAVLRFLINLYIQLSAHCSPRCKNHEYCLIGLGNSSGLMSPRLISWRRNKASSQALLMKLLRFSPWYWAVSKSILSFSPGASLALIASVV